MRVNFCKNPECANFGVPAQTEAISQGQKKEGKKERDSYKLTGSTKGLKKISVPCLACKLCNEYPPIKSNLGIFEEYQRISKYLENIPRELCCPNVVCENHLVGVSNMKGHYHQWGKTKAGTRRFRCVRCGRVFTHKKPAEHHDLAFKNPEIFRLLVNKVPFKRICAIAQIHPKTLYDKIDYIHQQCQNFAASREIKLIRGHVPMRRLYISVDRQDHVVNWSQRRDKRNTQFSAVGSSDNFTGYVFGMHLNFDSSLDARQVENEAIANGDYANQLPHRRFARLWLKGDYSKVCLDKALELTLSKAREGNKDLVDDIIATYDEAAAREDVEASDSLTANLKFPIQGMMIHAEYTLYAHFRFLSNLFAHAEKVRFFLDQESGIRAACMAAFGGRVLDRTCEAYYVKINKTLTVNQKLKIMAELKSEYDNRREILKFPDISDTSLRRMMIEENIDKMRPMGPWRDMWTEVPSYSMSEPEKQVCLLTDVTDYDKQRLAIILDRASLHGIDRFFMQARRLMSITERPISSASNTGRKWQQYGAYKPSVLAQLLDIFRVHYNYCKAGDDGKTPAMRLGLARSVLGEEVILRHQSRTLDEYNLLKEED